MKTALKVIGIVLWFFAIVIAAWFTASLIFWLTHFREISFWWTLVVSWQTIKELV